MKKIEQFYITELTLAGFKNYLEPATFVFGNPTVITGGNGQGKSTLADAVAFAVTGLPFFGERGIDRLYSGASGGKSARQGGRLRYHRSQDHFDMSCGIAGLYGCQLLHGHGGRLMVETELPWTSEKRVV